MQRLYHFAHKRFCLVHHVRLVNQGRINLNVYYEHFRYILVATINICEPYIFATNTPLNLLALLYPENRLLCNPDIVLAISSNYKGWAKSLASSSYLPSLAAMAPYIYKEKTRFIEHNKGLEQKLGNFDNYQKCLTSVFHNSREF